MRPLSCAKREDGPEHAHLVHLTRRRPTSSTRWNSRSQTGRAPTSLSCLGRHTEYASAPQRASTGPALWHLVQRRNLDSAVSTTSSACTPGGATLPPGLSPSSRGPPDGIQCFRLGRVTNRTLLRGKRAGPPAAPWCAHASCASRAAAPPATAAVYHASASSIPARTVGGGLSRVSAADASLSV